MKHHFKKILDIDWSHLKNFFLIGQPDQLQSTKCFTNQEFEKLHFQAAENGLK